MSKWANLLEINRNKNGNYYFIFSIPKVRNKINTKAKARNEVLIVGVPQSKLVNFLEAEELPIKKEASD